MSHHVLIRSIAVLAIGMGCLAVSKADDFKVSIPLGLIEPDIPSSSPLTNERVALGRRLFFDKKLSANEQTSCATCHDPCAGFSESRRTSIDAIGRRQRRNAPSIANAGYLTLSGWDGRYRSLEDQVKDSFAPWGDMAIELGDVVDKVERDSYYREAFHHSFGGPVTAERIAQAIASYERSVTSGGSRFDEYLFAGKLETFSVQEVSGYELFIGRASCINCHDIFHPAVNSLGGGIATFADHRFHNLGVGYQSGRMVDTGRYEVTRDPSDWGSFKTPMLRNVELTAPYMHDGSLGTLEEVVKFYNDGGIDNPNQAPGIQRLFLSEREMADLVSFMKTLTDLELKKGYGCSGTIE